MPSLPIATALLLLATAAVATEADVRGGKLLFDRPWRVPAGQDELGPLLNARSCAACHPGGSAGAPVAPALVLRTRGDAVLGRQLQPIALAGAVAETLPEPWSRQVDVDGTILTVRSWGAGDRVLAARLAPSLRGAGLLALIPVGLLRQSADPADRDGDGVSGQMGAGRFGAKAEHATLSEAVESALTLDMGLATEGHPATAGDCTSAQPECLAAAGDGVPVAARSIERLVAYVEALRPPPTATAPAGEGRRLFAQAGCAACHAGPYVIPSDPGITGRPSEAIAPFTDLLLHDLGPGLADPFAAPEAGEWRTPPLWGLRLRVAYLHDGRATSLAEAVAWHDGEAAASRRRFAALAAAERAALLAFLAGL